MSGHSSHPQLTLPLDTKGQGHVEPRRPGRSRLDRADPDDGGQHAMRGMFVALMVMGAVWTGGLVWSVFGGMVLVPQSASRSAGAKTATGSAAADGRSGRPGEGVDERDRQAAGPGRRGIGRPRTTRPRTPSRTATRSPRRRRATSPWSRSSWTASRAFELTAQVVQWEVAPGEFVEAYAYNGMVPGPLLRVTEGDTIRIVLKNELPEPTVLHMHGPRLPNSQDGVPDVTQPVDQSRARRSPTSSRSIRSGRSCTTPTTTRPSRRRRACTASSRSTRRASRRPTTASTSRW